MLASLKTIILKIVPFCPIVRFFPLYIHSRLQEKFHDHRRFLNKFWSQIEASTNFILDFLHKKTAIIVKAISAHSKSNVLILRAFKKIIISWHSPFKPKRTPDYVSSNNNRTIHQQILCCFEENICMLRAVLFTRENTPPPRPPLPTIASII
jgi:hypothetical protein